MMIVHRNKPIRDINNPNEGFVTNGTSIDDDDTRIVNGYDADKRPWLVMLKINGFLCGGSLINHKYALLDIILFIQ